jgi:rhodanese-related sulfurtransferase/DNA-binding transcriptional ArsR family regulator
MGNHAFKQQLYAEFARIGKALASSARLELLDLLSQGERPVEDLAREARLSVANTSAHLRVLSQAHLVTSRKQSLYVYYRLAAPAVYQLWAALQGTGRQQLAEIDRLVATYLHGRQSLDAISREQLQERLVDPATVVLDVRPALEYAQGHIAGARSIPLGELRARLDELDPTQPIVAYCRGPYCVFADEAVALLRDRGMTAARYEEGYPAWAAADLPVERQSVAASA